MILKAKLDEWQRDSSRAASRGITSEYLIKTLIWIQIVSEIDLFWEALGDITTSNWIRFMATFWEDLLCRYTS